MIKAGKRGGIIPKNDKEQAVRCPVADRDNQPGGANCLKMLKRGQGVIDHLRHIHPIVLPDAKRRQLNGIKDRGEFLSELRGHLAAACLDKRLRPDDLANDPGISMKLFFEVVMGPGSKYLVAVAAIHSVRGTCPQLKSLPVCLKQSIFQSSFRIRTLLQIHQKSSKSTPKEAADKKVEMKVLQTLDGSKLEKIIQTAREGIADIRDSQEELALKIVPYRPPLLQGCAAREGPHVPQLRVRRYPGGRRAASITRIRLSSRHISYGVSTLPAVDVLDVHSVHSPNLSGKGLPHPRGRCARIWQCTAWRRSEHEHALYCLLGNTSDESTKRRYLSRFSTASARDCLWYGKSRGDVLGQADILGPHRRYLGHAVFFLGARDVQNAMRGRTAVHPADKNILAFAHNSDSFQKTCLTSVAQISRERLQAECEFRISRKNIHNLAKYGSFAVKPLAPNV
ncbi:hypothetical protein BV25DRAFT_1835441 [Artomyces pyxidatus]|uniref:Uncharacterized protein n=1 Tax=Artomyces pyxidatus TaxID=48021 RepID=A0ACB8TFI7_9AGAM|nr:hypothetical protein BV25DRAFT_1835441 [Artomyces pyxidatus]